MGGVLYIRAVTYNKNEKKAVEKIATFNFKHSLNSKASLERVKMN